MRPLPAFLFAHNNSISMFGLTDLHNMNGYLVSRCVGMENSKGNAQNNNYSVFGVLNSPSSLQYRQHGCA